VPNDDLPDRNTMPCNARLATTDVGRRFDVVIECFSNHGNSSKSVIFLFYRIPSGWVNAEISRRERPTTTAANPEATIANNDNVFGVEFIA
jgi:hypothetical protein